MYALASLGAPSLLRGRRGTMCTAKGSDVRPGVPWVSTCFTWEVWVNVHCQGVRNLPWQAWNMYLLIYLLIHSPTHARTHARSHPLLHTYTHTQSLTHSLPPSRPHSPTPSLPLHLLHSTSFHFTHSLTYIIIIMCHWCLPATGHAKRVHEMCGCTRKSAEHYLGTLFLIVCREKNIRAWWNS